MNMAILFHSSLFPISVLASFIDNITNLYVGALKIRLNAPKTVVETFLLDILVSIIVVGKKAYNIMLDRR